MEEISEEAQHKTETEEEVVINPTEVAMITYQEEDTPTHTEEEVNKSHSLKITTRINPKGETSMDIEEHPIKTNQQTTGSKEKVCKLQKTNS